jgi:hypothetical protein
MTKVVALMSMSLDGYVADENDGVDEVFERNRLPARSPWECTEPKRSSSAWTLACSTRSTLTWLPCC